MKIWTDKQGIKLTPTEFLKRWKKGLQGVTPLQQTQVQVKSTWIMIFGIMAGIVICIIGMDNLWWLLIILIGALGNTFVQQLGLWQKKTLLENIEKMKGGLNGFK